MIKVVIIMSGSPQIASAQRQDPCVSGRTSGIVSITTRTSPTSRGTEAHPIRSHRRTSGGNVGCMMATPALITMVVA
jgi:hypothetical protein